jgi:thioredoxin 1
MTDKVLKFQAAWCGPCQALKMAMAGEDVGVEVEDVDVDSNPELAVKYRVRGVPTLIYLRDDQEIGRKVGGGTLQEVKTWVDLTKEGV